ncbi:MAG: dTDP-glucose 4,6-dehydratase [Pseudonocardiales bacterium]|nr:MAG: dTDP-glucose 4,6-dehydratase [Pseudonocardiales bacterium]
MTRAATARRVLITGAAGFIGSNLVHHWLAARPDDGVVALDSLTYAGVLESLDDVRDRVPFVHADIGAAAAVEAALGEHRIDTIVNLAAESHNSYAVLNPREFFSTNVLGTQTLLDAARAVGVDRVHHVSTCEVYGDLALDDPGAFTEQSPYRPRTPYNASKASADHLVRAYHETYGLATTISVCTNNYGPFQFPEKVLPLFITRALDDLPLPVYASSRNRREWLHVRDHCRAIESIVTRGRVGATYNVGSGFERTVDQVADAVLAALGKPASLKQVVPDRPSHDRRYLLDSGLIRGELGWRPQVGWTDGLAELVDWYATHRSWWEPLRDRAPVDETAWATGRP